MEAQEGEAVDGEAVDGGGVEEERRGRSHTLIETALQERDQVCDCFAARRPAVD